MKHELKIDYKETDKLNELISLSYKDGYLINKFNSLVIEKDTTLYNLCKGLHNLTVKLCNEDLIDGSLRMIISEINEEIKLYPCSIVYEMDNNKFSFII